jgi:hypothetical protein
MSIKEDLFNDDVGDMSKVPTCDIKGEGPRGDQRGGDGSRIKFFARIGLYPEFKTLAKLCARR